MQREGRQIEWVAARRGRPDWRRGDEAGWMVVNLVAVQRGVASQLLVDAARGRATVALARHLAMYLMHVLLQRTYAEVGQFFGRDRTTVSHACVLIEDRREKRRFDAEVESIEQAIAQSLAEERYHAAA